MIIDSMLQFAAQVIWAVMGALPTGSWSGHQLGVAVAWLRWGTGAEAYFPILEGLGVVAALWGVRQSATVIDVTMWVLKKMPFIAVE